MVAKVVMAPTEPVAFFDFSKFEKGLFTTEQIARMFLPGGRFDASGEGLWTDPYHQSKLDWFEEYFPNIREVVFKTLMADQRQREEAAMAARIAKRNRDRAEAARRLSRR
jgi:hypothetical protein